MNLPAVRRYARTAHAIAWLILPLATAHAGETVHKHLEAGRSFLISQEFQKPGEPGQTNHPRFDVLFLTNSGDLAVSAGDGPAQDVVLKPGEHHVISASFHLAPDGCAVDLIAGEPLLHGKQCSEAVPGNWDYIDTHHQQARCRTIQPAHEQIEVPAGTFDALKLECKREFGQPRRIQTTIYWYDPALGTMLRVVRTTADEKGGLVFSLTEQLEAIAGLPRYIETK